MAKVALVHQIMLCDNIWNHLELGGGSWAWGSNVSVILQHLC